MKNPKLNPSSMLWWWYSTLSAGGVMLAVGLPEDIPNDEETPAGAFTREDEDFGGRRSANPNNHDIWIWISKTVIGDGRVGDGCYWRLLHRAGSRFAQRWENFCGGERSFATLDPRGRNLVLAIPVRSPSCQNVAGDFDAIAWFMSASRSRHRRWSTGRERQTDWGGERRKRGIFEILSCNLL